MYDTILSPIDYGGLQLKNRIIFAPTTFGLSDEEYLAEMERLAKGGCAMIIIGDVPVAKSQFEKSLFDKKGFAFYQQICETAHKYGCKVCAQLHQTDTDMMSIIKCIPGMLMKKITPDQLRERMNDAVGPYITKMSQKKIHQIIAGFGKAAVPGMAIDYKLAVRQENPHYGNAGVVEEELAVFVPLLVQAGVTSFHVTLANHSALENTIPPASHPEFKETGCFLKFCDEVRRYTSVPLCGVGGLNDPDFVEQQLASGRIQCAAMCRQLLADPNWVNKLQSGNAAKIHRCVRCNKKCLGGLIAHQGTRCVYDALNAKEQGSI